MGRTVPSFRMVIEEEFGSLEKFKRALRKVDREALEEMLYKARLHMQAGSYASFIDPLDAILLGVLIEHEKKLRELSERGTR